MRAGKRDQLSPPCCALFILASSRPNETGRRHELGDLRQAGDGEWARDISESVPCLLPAIRTLALPGAWMIRDWWPAVHSCSAERQAPHPHIKTVRLLPLRPCFMQGKRRKRRKPSGRKAARLVVFVAPPHPQMSSSGSSRGPMVQRAWRLLM